MLWHGFITDVTERRKAMQAVADARALLQSVLDAATEAAIIATDVDGRDHRIQFRRRAHVAI